MAEARKENKKKFSAGILMFRRAAAEWQVFLAHPGGPFWSRKDAGAWSIPKGECDDGEDPLAAAQREFLEETGFPAGGEFMLLGDIRQASGKVVRAWAVEGDCDAQAVRSITFSMEWPKGSGRMREFPEVDRAAWFTFSEARAKILPGQSPFLDRLENIIGGRS